MAKLNEVLSMAMLNKVLSMAMLNVMSYAKCEVLFMAMLSLCGEIVFQKRRELIKDKLEPTTAIKEGNKVVDSKDQLAQIIDTTLLKCYLQVLYAGILVYGGAN